MTYSPVEDLEGLGSLCGVMKELDVSEGSLALDPTARGQPYREISAFPFHTSRPDSIFLTQCAAEEPQPSLARSRLSRFWEATTRGLAAVSFPGASSWRPWS